MRITRREFEALVEEALEALPQQFKALLDNVVVVVEEEPTEEDYEALEGDDEEGEDDELLGIFRGFALTERTFDMLPTLPNQVAIFRGPILRVARTREEVVDEVRETVIHELGHFFGLGDHEMIY
ncbi:MAG TPA: metallopeptidase family protein [Thermoanaerobaculia bacterium]|jgi:predicted Zn-dependent protease with MMP-like domain